MVGEAAGNGRLAGMDAGESEIGAWKKAGWVVWLGVWT